MSTNLLNVAPSHKERLDEKDVLVWFTVFLFCATLALKSFTDALYVAAGNESAVTSLKYVTAAIGIVVGWLYMFRTHRFNVFRREFHCLIGIWILFLAISLCSVIYFGNIPPLMPNELMRLAMPMLFAYVILNTLSFKQIYYSMKFILYISIIGYLIEIFVTEKTTVSEIITSTSFSASQSPLETSNFYGPAIALCFFFSYYRRDKVSLICSVIFAIAVFKRLEIIFAVIAFVFPYFFNYDRRISSKWNVIIPTFFIMLTGVYFYMLLPANSQLFQSIFGTSQGQFTMGRSYNLQRVLEGDYVMHGYGSIMSYLGRGLEMDLIGIVLEISPIALIIFLFLYWQLVGSCLYNALLMFYCFASMETAGVLDQNFQWLLVFIILGCTNYFQNQSSVYKRLIHKVDFSHDKK